MKIVIDIDHKRYKDVLRISTVQLKGRTPTLEQVIANGTPLPKGHGRLIDADALIDEMPIDLCDGYEAIDVIERVSPIIEADKESDSE